MIRLTLIARVMDGLILAGQSDDDRDQYTNLAKNLFKKMSQNTPAKRSLDSGTVIFHYSIEMGICYLCLTDKGYPRELAFSYLGDLHNDFYNEYGMQVNSAARPYSFVKFTNNITRIKKKYLNVNETSNVDKVKQGISDVQNIMTENIQIALDRGQKITSIADTSESLRAVSGDFVKEAKYANLREWYRKWGPVAIVSGIGMVSFYLWLFIL